MAAIFGNHPFTTVPTSAPSPSTSTTSAFGPAPTLSSSRKRVFESVFPPSQSSSLPTPLATPVNSFVNPHVHQSPTAPGVAHVGGLLAGAASQSQGAEAFYKRERYWHIVTSFLSFPGSSSFTGIGNLGDALEGSNNGGPGAIRDQYIKKKEWEENNSLASAGRRGVTIEEAIKWLLEYDGQSAGKGKDGGGDHDNVGGDNDGAGLSGGVMSGGVQSLSEWYTHEVRRHFLGYVRGDVVRLLNQSYKRDHMVEEDERYLKRILRELRTAWEIYTGVYKRWILKNPALSKKVANEDLLGGLAPISAAHGKFTKPTGAFQTPGKNAVEDADGEEDPMMTKFTRSLNSLISFSLPDPQWSELVYKVFVEWCGVILNSPSKNPRLHGGSDFEEDIPMDDSDGVHSKDRGSSLFTPQKHGENHGILDDSIIDEEDVDLTQKDPPYAADESFNSQATDHEGDISLIFPQPETPKHPSGRSNWRLSSVHPEDVEDFPQIQKDARKKLLAAWDDMQILNLGGSGRRGERVFAEVVNVLVTKYIEETYSGDWKDAEDRNVTKEVGDWIEYKVGGLVRLVLLGGKRFIESKIGTRLGSIIKEGKNKVLSPRASFRASNFGAGHARPGGVRISIDGVMLGDAGTEIEKLRRDEDLGDVLRKEDIEGWKRMAMGRLGRLRVTELFEIVVDWPDSMGGVTDLRAYITTPQTRLHLTTTFTTAISNRILHPAASTTDILRVYISLIRAFAVLDPRGVLLDRVTRGIRRYLREREDTVRVIVRGLMGGNSQHRKADLETENIMKAEEDDLSDLAAELIKSTRTSNDYNTASAATGATSSAAADLTGATNEIDFDDMSWVPDPIDAGPEYRKSKGTDVIGSLISLYESKEVFVREFQTVLAERLLETRSSGGNTSEDADTDYEAEICTLELLRIRFGEAPLQACDVMVKDITDSKRMDNHIHIDQHLNVHKPTISTSPTHPNRTVTVYPSGHPPEFHSKILSHLFWPTMKAESFILPQVIENVKQRYEKGFEKLAPKRKLTWYPSIGDVHLEIELEDRIVVVEDAQTWAAAVIGAFSGEHGDDEPSSASSSPKKKTPVRRTVKELLRSLKMDESLVRRALVYWVSKGVLRESLSTRDTYIVIERLSDLEEIRHRQNQHQTPHQTPRKSHQHAHPNHQESPLKEEDKTTTAANRFPPQFTLYTSFILAMLTNNGPMSLERIVMMLGMLVPGGITARMEEIGELLESLKAEEKVVGGEGEGGSGEGVWRVKK